MTSEILHRLGDRWHGLWQHLPLKTLGILSALLPMVAVVASAVLAFADNENRQRLETAVTRHFEMVGRLDALLTLLLDAETGLRGHLLTRREEFLEPFAQARKSLPDELKALRSFIEAEPGAEPRAQKRARLEAIETAANQEMDLLARLQEAPAGASAGAVRNNLTDQFIRSKELMDDLRGRLREMQADEKRLLGQRLEEIRRVRRRDYLSVSLALFLGLLTRGVVFWLFNRRVVQRVEHLTANVRALAADGTLPHAPTGRRDAIGELEQAVHDAHSKLPATSSAGRPSSCEGA